LTFQGLQTRTSLTLTLITYATHRLSKYNHAPTHMVFESIFQTLCYLAQDIFHPVLYLCHDFSGALTVTWYAIAELKLELKAPNVPNVFVDVELTRYIATCQSYYCIIITVLNVVVFFKIKKTSKVMVHTTASEMKATYHQRKNNNHCILPIYLDDFIDTTLASTQYAINA
jgi:hypothetical protein